MEAVNGQLRNGGPIGAMICAVAMLLSGCYLTDHTERDEVSTRDLNFPASGYEKLDAKDYPRITFDAVEFDMGKVVQGARVEKVFRFTNTGRSPLVLSAVNSTCGCTVGRDWPKAPIASGAQGEITVVFDSEGRTGMQHKSITVVSNALPASTVLTLFGEVIGPDTNQQP